MIERLLMKPTKSESKELVAPCGMNCAVCSRYLAYAHGMKRSQCRGCRPSGEKCTYLFKECGGPKNEESGRATFCFECDQYPCKRLERMDRRYRVNYQMSILENLESIRKRGVAPFVREQKRKYRCPKCAGLRSVHNGKCFECDPITRLVERRTSVKKIK